jgi:hypothetical protein
MVTVPPIPKHAVGPNIPVSCDPFPANAKAVTVDVARMEFCTVTLDVTVAGPTTVNDSVATNMSNVLTVLEWQTTGHAMRIPRKNLHVLNIENALLLTWDLVFIETILHFLN